MADTVDASIPLAGANIAAAGEQSMISAFNFATQLQEYQRQQRAQNALKQLFTDPNSVDPATGLPTTKAVATIMKIDPEMGMKLSDEMITLNVNRLKEKAAQSDQGKAAFDYSTKVAGIVTGIYDDTLASTGDPAKAAEAARNERNDLFKNNGGILSDDEADRGIAAPFDINVARRLQEASPDYVKTAKTLEQINAERASMGLPPLTSLSGVTSPSTVVTVPVPPGKPVTLADAADRYAITETSGDSTKENTAPGSHAGGLDQFQPGTWLSMMKKYRPDLTKGKTDEQILAMRSDAGLQKEMTEDYAKDNAGFLKSNKLPVTTASLYLAHHWGPEGAKALLTADPNVPAASVLDAKSVAANQAELKGKTVGDIIAIAQRKEGNNPIEGFEDATGASANAPAWAGKDIGLPDPSTPEGKAMMGGKGWSPNLVTVDGQDARYNPGRHLYTNPAGTEWIVPGDKSKIFKVGGPGSGDTFTPQMSALMAALAEEGVSLPTGFRSKQQQIALYQGLLDRNPDKTPDQIATAIKLGQIEFGAQKKETLTAATIAGKVTVAANELDEFIPLVEKASKALPREKFIHINKLLQMGETEISDPRLITLRTQLNTLMNAYDLLASRGGEDVEKRARARALITEAQSPEGLQAGLDAFKSEALAAKRAAFRATKVPELEDASGGGDKPAKASTAPQKVVAVSTKEEYDALPPGAWYSKPGDPPGKHRVKS